MRDDNLAFTEADGRERNHQQRIYNIEIPRWDGYWDTLGS